MNNELEWRSIPNTQYLISEFGDIFSKKTNKILVQQNDLRGYQFVTLYLNGDKTTCKIHRLVGRYFLNEIQGLQINHKDGNKTNNHYTNLEYVTSKENHQHAIRTGLMPIGIAKPGAKLTNELVELIKLLMVENIDDMEISEYTGVVTATISKIRHGKRWTHIRPDLQLPINSSGIRNNGFAKRKLLASDIPKIHDLYKNGKTLAEIGRIYSVHSGTIDSIVKGRTWKNY